MIWHKPACSGRNFSNLVQQTVVINSGLRFAPVDRRKCPFSSCIIEQLTADMVAVLHAMHFAAPWGEQGGQRTQKTKSS